MIAAAAAGADPRAVTALDRACSEADSFITALWIMRPRDDCATTDA